MIDISTKIHDRFTLEFKVGFVTGKGREPDDFSLAMWLFVPGGLDITPSTYSKDMFYSDVKSNIRLITPAFPLGDLAAGGVPLAKLKESARAVQSGNGSMEDFEYDVKMFCAIVKSSLREGLAALGPFTPDKVAGWEKYVDDAESVLDSFHSLRPASGGNGTDPGMERIFLRGDEFLGDIMSKYLMEFIRRVEGGLAPAVSQKAALLYRKIGRHDAEMGFPVIREDDPGHNRTYTHRFSALKKYVEEVLYLRAPKKRDGVLLEQLYLSIAAGLAMLFATVVSFAFQKKFGSLTLPLFIALIVSYMLKDRIKELMRYYLAHRVGGKFFDNKARIIHKDTEFGWLKEGFDFVQPEKVPRDVAGLRNRSHMTDIETSTNTERVLMYRKSVHLDSAKLLENTEYSFSGINDIFRLNVTNFIKKADNPVVLMNTMDEEGVLKTVPCDREYYINLVFRYSYDGTVELKRFRIALSRDGIRAIEEVAR